MISMVNPLPSVIVPAFKNPAVLAPTPIVNPEVPILNVVAEASNVPPSEMINAESVAREPATPSLSVPLLTVVDPL